MENYARNILHQLTQRDVSEIVSICAFTSRRNHDILRLDEPRVRTVLVEDEQADRQILVELEREKADALLCPLVTLEPRAVLIPSFVAIPDIQHEVYPDFFDAATLAVLRELYPASVASASGVFTISEYSKQTLIKAYGLEAGKVVVTHLAADEAFRVRYDVEQRQEVRRRYGVPARYVLYPAITWPHKNHVTLLRSVRRFNDRHPPVSVVLTGSAAGAAADVEREIGRLGLESWTHRLGYVTQQDLACLYQDALALIFPSLFEGFGLPILESFHCGCPVLCSEGTSCPEIAGDAAMYVDPRDPEAIAAALAAVDGSPELRRSLVARGHERVGRFSWEESGRRTYETIRAEVERARGAVEVTEEWPWITVVTPSFNQARFITETIESVLSQDYPRLDYVVMDGGSTDGTIDILRRYGDRLRWVSEPDRGQADAVNKGVATASGEIIGWLNSDDTYAPGALRAIGRVFRTRADLDVVYGDADHVLADGIRHSPYPTAPFDHERLAESCFICQPAAFFRRQAFDAVGGLDVALHFCMDYDLWIRMGRQHRIAYLPERLACSRLHGGAKTLASRRKVFKEIIRTVKRHYGLVPFEWSYGYADYLFNRSARDLFAPKRASILAFAASLVLGLWLNLGRPSYWGKNMKKAGRLALRGLRLPTAHFDGRWSDGWISRRYVTQLAVPVRTGCIEVRGRHQMPGRRPLHLTVFVDGVSAGEHVLRARGPFTLHVPIARAGERTVTLEIVANRTFCPIYRGRRDGRTLSCLIDSLTAE
jgi:glycosyltransferase involved in cell wall biosynthesis